MESLSTASGHQPNSLSSTLSRSHYESSSMADAAAAASLTSTAPSASPSPALSTSTVTTLPSTSISFSDSVPASNPASASASATVSVPTYQSSSHPPSRDNCERRREGEEEIPSKGLIKMPFDLAGKTLSPFLKEHIPGLYAPVGKNFKKEDNTSSNALVNIKDPNTKYCYRHRPDSKCRRAADETKMGTIQRELNNLPSTDQEAITHVWSLFSAAPAKHRELMLQGIITQCCFPQLSTVSREVQEQLKIDFIATLPVELSYKILCNLDTVSLCKAAQVSRRWRDLADDDVVWHRMCEQHIDRKCTKCGWGLPLLERKKLMAWNRHQHTAHGNPPTRSTEDSAEPASTPAAQGSNKRAMVVRDDSGAKRSRVRNSPANGRAQLDEERKFRPWKDVYRDRYKVGYNWKTGRCSIRTFKGHENGVTCLQFDHNILATGSYDTTIKIWNVETGECIRTLSGHTSTIRTLQFDEGKLISGSFDKTIKIWNWHTGECISTLQGHTDGVLSIHFDGCKLASGSIDKTVKIFNFDTKQTWTLRGHSDWVNHVRIDSASRTVFSASDDLTVKLWDLDTKQCLKTYLGHVGQVQQILLMPPDFEPDEDPNADAGDAASAASGRGDSPVPLPEQSPDSRTAFGPSFSDPSRPLPPRYMLTGGLDNTVRLWDIATGKCIRSMFGHVEGIWGLVGDTLRVVTGANDSMTKVWEPRSGKCERSFTGHAGPVTCVGLSDSRMASGSEDGEVRLYSFEGNSLEERGTPS